MESSTQTGTSGQLVLVLDPGTAADLMTPRPVSIRQEASLSDAIELLAKHDVSALPVLNEAGRPVGVLSRTDVVRWMRESGGHAWPSSGDDGKGPSKSYVARPQGGASEPPQVQQVMAPALLSVKPTTPVVEVVAQLLGLGNVHRLFVVDDAGTLVGVVSARDILRKLHRKDTD